MATAAIFQHGRHCYNSINRGLRTLTIICRLHSCVAEVVLIRQEVEQK